jgi:geranylgeranyl pyrophosphate synthase
MFATALERMARLGAAEAATLAHAIASMARGAFDEVLDEHSGYAHTIRCKTGSLFAAAARLGALAAAAGLSQLEAASEFGMCLGEAYQVADDLADVGELRDKPGLQATMRQAIALHIEHAQAALVRFPDNECTRMLRDMPAEFVSSMAPA